MNSGTPNKTLNNDLQMPQLGLGTWKLNGEEAVRAVQTALELGYRHLDTASLYGNEREIGQALAESKVAREDIFITSKIWNDEHNNPRAALERSLEKLQTDYLDQYLIHWPVPAKLDTWAEFEQFYEEGLCCSIGVSNFSIADLKELGEISEQTPAVNQVELNPRSYNPDLLQYCKEQNIAVVAYSPLRQAEMFNDLLVTELAEKYNKAPAQILLHWVLEHEAIVIPKAAQKQHQAINMEIFNFELEPEDVEALNQLSTQ